MSRTICAVLTMTLLTAAGCAEEEITFTEIPRPDERFSETSVRDLIRALSIIPAERRNELPPLFPPVPDWNPERTLSVTKLVEEEIEATRTLWDERRVAMHLKSQRRLQRTLQKMQMTPEQFVGLLESVGIAYARLAVRDEDELRTIIRKGASRIARLERDQRTYASLNEDERYAVFQSATWITRVNRASRLLQPPFENVVLAQRFAEALRSLLPASFLEPPLAQLIDREDQLGIPFEENAESGYDLQLTGTDRSLPVRVGTAQIDRLFADRVDRLAPTEVGIPLIPTDVASWTDDGSRSSRYPTASKDRQPDAVLPGTAPARRP